MQEIKRERGGDQKMKDDKKIYSLLVVGLFA